MSDTEAPQGTRETAKASKPSELVGLWLDAIALANNDEKNWRDCAQDTVDIYRNTKRRYNETVSVKDRTFNILHSNVETILPAIYNSTPIPDVRRRFGDDDKAGKEVADLIERALSFSVDSYDFDETLKHDVKDMELVGRGLSRVRYLPYLTENQEAPDEEVQESGQELNESLTYEEVACEHVPWKHFRRGPARVWADVPWIAFELFLTRDELVKLSPKDGGKVKLDVTMEGADSKRDGDNVKEIFKRGRVWEIWDKESRRVLFIAESFKDRPLKIADDPLELMGFFPIPRPLYAIETSDNLVPVIPYDIYRDQAEELERVSQRIIALTESIKSRGLYDGSMQEIDQLSEADDNTLISVQNVARYADGSGIEKGIAWWPIEPAVKALQQLVEQREQIKATIYEITGISDILRGDTQASETATAQQIKQQWGSLRIQNKQQNIQRYARDLFRLKAEIIANKFQWETISLMTGLNYPTQAEKQQAQMAIQQMQARAQMQAQMTGQPAPPPQIPPPLQQALEKPSREEIEQLLRNDATRNFRVDVESDSTIRADLTRNQQNMTLFLQGTAQFAQAMGPIVMTFKEMTPAVIEVYSAFARNFKLGKQAEDALDGIADKAAQAAQQPAPPQQPDPKIELEKIKMQAEQQRHAQEMEMKQAEFQQEAQAKELEMQMKREELELKKQELLMKREEAEMKLQQDREIAEVKLRMDAEKHEQAMQQQTEQHQLKLSEQAAAAQAAEAKRQLTEKDAQAEFEFGQQDRKIRLEGSKQKLRQQSEAHNTKMRFDEEEFRAKQARAAEEAERAKKPKVTKFTRGKDGRVESAVTEH